MSSTKGKAPRKGALQEGQAAKFLEGKGYQVLQKNYYSPFGEIDLVARQGRYLVFVEVKYRKDSKGGHPRICKSALHYCLRHGYGEQTPCRFDVVGILGEEMIHVEDAFPFSG